MGDIPHLERWLAANPQGSWRDRLLRDCEEAVAKERFFAGVTPAGVLLSFKREAMAAQLREVVDGMWRRASGEVVVQTPLPF